MIKGEREGLRINFSVGYFFKYNFLGSSLALMLSCGLGGVTPEPTPVPRTATSIPESIPTAVPIPTVESPPKGVHTDSVTGRKVLISGGMYCIFEYGVSVRTDPWTCGENRDEAEEKYQQNH